MKIKELIKKLEETKSACYMKTDLLNRNFRVNKKDVLVELHKQARIMDDMDVTDNVMVADMGKYGTGYYFE